MKAVIDYREQISPSYPSDLKTNPHIGSYSTRRIIGLEKKNSKTQRVPVFICVPVVYKMCIVTGD